MKAQSLNILTMMVFGIGGIVILALTWTRPVPVSEWLLNSSIGFSGLGWAMSQLLLIILKHRMQNQRMKVEIDPDNSR